MSQRLPNGSTSDVVWQQSRRGIISLRYQLAEDGCVESQLALAKNLLSEPASNREERHINANVAIYWLLRAAERGHHDAFLLLKQCSDTGIGVNCDNFFSIEKCLKLSENEVIARRVGYSIFSAVMSDTEESIAEDTFQERVELILKEAKTDHDVSSTCGSSEASLWPPTHKIFRENVESASQKVFKENVENVPPQTFKESTEKASQKLTKENTEKTQKLEKAPQKTAKESMESAPQKIFESVEGPPSPPVATTKSEPCLSVGDVVSSVQQCLEGNLPLVALRRVAQYEEYNKWFSLKYAHKLSSMLRNALIILVKEMGTANLPFVFFLCSIAAVGDVKSLINDRIFFCSVIALITIQCCSCYIIHLNLGYHNITQWLDLIKLFEPNVKFDEVKQKYLGKTFFPFLIFVAASVILNILFPFGSMKFIYRELFVFSVVVLVLLDRTITHQRRYVNVSLMLNVICCLYKGNLLVNADSGWLNYLNFKACFPIYGEYAVNLNWLTCISLPLVLPYLYTKMAFGSEKRGWFLVLLPHLMCLTWLNFAFNFYEVCESGDVLWSCLFWVTVLILTNYLGAILSLVLVSVAKGLYLTSGWSNMSILSAVFLFICSFFVLMFLVNKLKSMLKTSLFVLLLSSTFAFIVFVRMSPSYGQTEASEPVLPWAKYEVYCHRHAWYRTNTAEVEIACLPLKGRRISVEGTVTEIDIAAIKNNVNYFVSFLPSPLSQWLTCALGDSFCGKENLSPLEKERCLLYDSLKVDRCHLHNWDTYQYRILLEVSSRTSPEIIIHADHHCSSFIRTLKEGDSLHISGVLDGSIGSNLPEISLQEATCSTCSENTSCKTLHDSGVKFDSSLSLRQVVKFYFSPFIQYIN